VKKTQTDRGAYLFVVKEYADGEPWIMMERQDQGIEILQRGFLGFELKNGTPLMEAEKLAVTLSALIKSVSYTALRE
jgi:hypothetical protein